MKNYNTKETAELIGLHEQTILRAIRENVLVAKKNNSGRYVITETAIIDYCKLKKYECKLLGIESGEASK